MIIEAVNDELVITSESQDEFMLLSKLHGKLVGSEIDSVRRCFSLGAEEECPNCEEREDILTGNCLHNNDTVKELGEVIDEADNVPVVSLPKIIRLLDKFFETSEDSLEDLTHLVSIMEQSKTVKNVRDVIRITEEVNKSQSESTTEGSGKESTVKVEFRV